MDITKDYSDILDSKRPEHIGDDFSIRHPRMPREDRAKIFAPFAALSGHADRTRERERITSAKAELSESAIAEIDTALRTIAGQLCSGEKALAEIIYFEEDNERKGEGIYKTVLGYVENIDIFKRVLTINTLNIKLDSIYAVLNK